mgnify:CR=1 FL=1
MPYFLGVLLIGVVTGLLSGAFGIGGATITTPFLRDVLRSSGHIALGTPLPIVILMAFSGALVYHRKKLIRYEIALPCALAGSLTAIFTASCTQYLSGRALMLITSLYIGIVAVKFWKGTPRRKARRGRKLLSSFLIGLVGGGVSGFLGVGGGIVLVPGFTLLLGLPIHQAIGTSLLTMALYSIPGSVVHYLLGHVDLGLLPPLLLGSVVGAQGGARLAVRAREPKLRNLFTVYLFIVAAVMAAFEIFHIVK